MHPVWLLEIRGHFCQELVAGDPNVDREAKDVVYGVLDGCCRLDGRIIVPLAGSEIHITFVYADLFDVGAKGG